MPAVRTGVVFELSATAFDKEKAPSFAGRVRGGDGIFCSPRAGEQTGRFLSYFERREGDGESRNRATRREGDGGCGDVDRSGASFAAAIAVASIATGDENGDTMVIVVVRKWRARLHRYFWVFCTIQVPR